MRRIQISIAAIIASSHLAQAVSLADFIPLLQSLPAACDTAYRQTIPGCSVTDFSAPYICSQSCLNGLVQTNGAVTTACSGVTVDPKSIVGLFLLGEGIQALCNVAVVTKTTGSAQPVSLTVASGDIPIIFPTGGAITVSPGPRPDVTTTMTIDSMSSTTGSSSSSSTASSGSSTTSTTLKSTTSVTSSSKATTASAGGVSAKQNPSVPDCSNRSSQGSPFDSFTDQQCEKNAASRTKMSPFAAVIGLMYAMLLIST